MILSLAPLPMSSFMWMTSHHEKTGPSIHVYRYSIAQWPHLPTPHFILLSNVIRIWCFGMPIFTRFCITNLYMTGGPQTNAYVFFTSTGPISLNNVVTTPTFSVHFP